MTEQDLSGKKFVAVYRRSKRKQTYSIDRQRDLCQPMIEMYKIKISYEVVLDDHSATAGAQWEAMYKIIEHKTRGGDFHGVLACDYSRLARTMDEAERFYLDCADVGLVLLTQKEGLLSGKDAWVKRNAAAAANERFGENLGVATSSGIMRLIKAGLMPHTASDPYGFDRLILSPRDEPLYRLRRTPDGRLLKLTAEAPYEVIEVFEGTTRNDFPRRQKNERATLVFGDSTAVATVRRVFELSLVGSGNQPPLGTHSVAKLLNSEGCVSPTGKEWSSSTVRSLLRNYTYTGVGPCCRYGMGVHSLRHKDSPKLFGAPRRPEKRSGGRRQQVKTIFRPADEWYIVRYPALFHFLPPRLRRLAKAKNRMSRGRKAGVNRRVRLMALQSRMHESGYFLSGLVFTEHGHMAMGGTATKLVYKGREIRYRYYLIDPEKRPAIMKGKGYKKTLPADSLEKTFLDLLAHIVRNRQDFARTVMSLAKSRLLDTDAADEKATRLERERSDAEDHLKMIVRLGPKALPYATEDAERLVAKIERLSAELNDLQAKDWAYTESDLPNLVKTVTSQVLHLEKLARTTKEDSVLRGIARLLVREILFDGLTRRVTFHMAIPKRLLECGEKVQDIICPGGFCPGTQAKDPKNATALIAGTYVYQVVFSVGRVVKAMTLVGASGGTNGT